MTKTRLDLAGLDDNRLVINYDELTREYQREFNTLEYQIFLSRILNSYENEIKKRGLQ